MSQFLEDQDLSIRAGEKILPCVEKKTTTFLSVQLIFGYRRVRIFLPAYPGIKHLKYNKHQNKK